MANTIIKWPGGKTREIKYVEGMIPPFRRYIEPFFGGGAMFFHLRPEKAVINDISRDLMDFYALVKDQDPLFRRYLTAYREVFDGLVAACDRHFDGIAALYLSALAGEGLDAGDLAGKMIGELPEKALSDAVPDREAFTGQIRLGLADKARRTVKNQEKSAFSDEDLRENLITGAASGAYMYFRDVYNRIHLGRAPEIGREYAAANFYFVREYCYGSMFRYNAGGEFNIPYGGMSYNRKDLGAKVEEMFSGDMARLFAGAEIHCRDFGELLGELDLTGDDFMFLDPPYDSDFSDYEGRHFGKDDHVRLRDALKTTPAKFILIIRNTDFISSLYEKGFNVLSFDKTYTYNVRSRNNRSAQHLIVTNFEP